MPVGSWEGIWAGKVVEVVLAGDPEEVSDPNIYIMSRLGEHSHKVDSDCIQSIAPYCMLVSWLGGIEFTGLSVNPALVLKLEASSYHTRGHKLFCASLTSFR